MRTTTYNLPAKPIRHKPFVFAWIVLILSPFAQAYAESASTDRPLKCGFFDYEQWQRDHPRPAGKALADLNVGEPGVVRLIYFKPSDRPHREAVVDSLKAIMRQVHSFFGKQMAAHGYAGYNFRFEKDAAGQPKVHRVDGQHPSSHYLEFDYTSSPVLEEVTSVFSLAESVYLIYFDESSWIRSGGRDVAGVGGGWKNSGFALVASRSEVGTYAHEVGHAFGLPHDFRDDAYVMSYGYIPDEFFLSDQLLSSCNAQILAISPFLNRRISHEWDDKPTAEVLTSSPVPTANAASVSVRFKARDPSGLHLAVLNVAADMETDEPTWQHQTAACRGLDGQTDSTIEFEYDGQVPGQPSSNFYTFRAQKAWVDVINTSGDKNWSPLIELVNADFREPLIDFSTGHPSPEHKNGSINPITFSAQGALLGLQVPPTHSGAEGPLRLWNLSTGRLLHSIPHRGLWARTLSPDGKRLALGFKGGALEIWDLQNGTRLLATRLEYLYSEINVVAFSPDGSLLATGNWFGGVDIWDATDGQSAAYFSQSSGNTPTAIAFSPDGKQLAVLRARGVLDFFTIEEGIVSDLNVKKTGTLRAHPIEARGQSLSFSPDGKLLASGGIELIRQQSSHVKLWDTTTLKHVATLEGGAPVLFSPDGKLLATASARDSAWSAHWGEYAVGGAVKLWDVATRQQVAKVLLLDYPAKLAFSPDMSMLAASSHLRTRAWDVSAWTGAEPKPEPVLTETDEDGGSMVGVLGKTTTTPDRTTLFQNAPNPFNSQTVVSYFLLRPGPARFDVFSLTGQRVASLRQGPQRAGYHRLYWDGRDATGHPVASGVYLYRLTTDEGALTRKLILLR